MRKNLFNDLIKSKKRYNFIVKILGLKLKILNLLIFKIEILLIQRPNLNNNHKIKNIHLKLVIDLITEMRERMNLLKNKDTKENKEEWKEDLEEDEKYTDAIKIWKDQNNILTTENRDLSVKLATSERNLHQTRCDLGNFQEQMDILKIENEDKQNMINENLKLIENLNWKVDELENKRGKFRNTTCRRFHMAQDQNIPSK